MLRRRFLQSLFAVSTAVVLPFSVGTAKVEVIVPRKRVKDKSPDILDDDADNDDGTTKEYGERVKVEMDKNAIWNDAMDILRTKYNVKKDLDLNDKFEKDLWESKDYHSLKVYQGK